MLRAITRAFHLYVRHTEVRLIFFPHILFLPRTTLASGIAQRRLEVGSRREAP